MSKTGCTSMEMNVYQMVLQIFFLKHEGVHQVLIEKYIIINCKSIFQNNI